MRKNLSLPDFHYRGRFSPSPTGPLHFGSLIAAVGSYLDAKHQHGIWLIRIEDVDTPRCIPGVADDILRTLEMFGLHSDEPVIYQSQRTAIYAEGLYKLKINDAAYPCGCTRKEITDSALNGVEGPVYPGTCRHGLPEGRQERGWRVRTDNAVLQFEDSLQGTITQNLENEVGDFIVKRADGLFAYQLAVVMDDALQGITHIVRGADLLSSTPRQIHLQQLFGFPVPLYMHLPVAVNTAGEKLSKQTLATPVDISRPAETLLRVLEFLQQSPPAEVAACKIESILDWAVQNWNPITLRGIKTLPTV